PGNKAVTLREPPLACDIVGPRHRARGRMDTWNGFFQTPTTSAKEESHNSPNPTLDGTVLSWIRNLKMIPRRTVIEQS
ncbi:MAG: hypothetical protein AB7N71_08810, partial [Phycisphaerae bacterium]